MAVYSIKTKKGSWTSGEEVTINVPVYTPPAESNYYSGTSYDAFSLKFAELQTLFDPRITFISYSSYCTSFLNSMGFTNIIELDYVEDEETLFYVNEKQYMSVAFSQIATLVDLRAGTDGIKSNVLSNKYGLGGRTSALWSAFIPSYKGTTNETWLLLGKSLVPDTGKTYYTVGVYVADSGGEYYNDFYFNSGLPEYDDSDDPYKDGGYSGSGGGTGTFSGTGDSIEFPNLPTLSAVSTGFITLFNPSIAQMQSLATYMWSDVFDIGLYKTLFADPMDCILGCSIVPVAVPNGGTKTVNVGNVSTGISMTVAASQYVEVDCGTLNVEEYWGSYLDYDPYTKAEIYLPYCGTHALQVDDIMGKAVHVKYHVDILSGACCAYVKCGGSVMYSFVGQCSSSIPISANDWTNVVNGALTIAASVGSLIATGGASAPMAVGAAAAVTGTIYGGGIKQNVEKSGSMGGTGGMLAVQTPYLILTRPRQALPKKQNTYTGYPSFITTKLEDLKGYTEIDSIRITGVPATDAELNELESILKSGVIF